MYRATRVAVRRLVLAAALAALAGCATVPPPAAPSRPATVLWRQRRGELQCLDRWRMQGRMALAAHGKGWSANIDWRQQGTRYDMRLSGPFGWGGFRLQGSPRMVLLQKGDKRYRFFESPETVIRQEFGMTIPVSGMRYWVLGNYAPAGKPRYRLDRYGRLASLSQQGWSIDYAGYGRSDGFMLPTRITMRRNGVRLKLAVDTWTLADAAACEGAGGGRR